MDGDAARVPAKNSRENRAWYIIVESFPPKRQIMTRGFSPRLGAERTNCRVFSGYKKSPTCHVDEQKACPLSPPIGGRTRLLSRQRDRWAFPQLRLADALPDFLRILLPAKPSLCSLGSASFGGKPRRGHAAPPSLSWRSCPHGLVGCGRRLMV